MRFLGSFQKKVEDARAQLQFHSLSQELKALKEAISASDKQATAQLCAAKDQLQSLHGTVCKINQERTEVRCCRNAPLENGDNQILTAYGV